MFHNLIGAFRRKAGHKYEIFYHIDSATGKKEQITNAKARELIEKEKVEWIRDEDSKVKVEFVFSAANDCRAYWLARDGSKRDIDLEYVLRLIMENKARIHEIHPSE